MAHEAQGGLVRSWRRHAGLSQADVAAHLHTVKPAISNYESAGRDISFETMKLLDDLFGAGGALFDMAQALGTPTALTARERWVFHPETPRPVVTAHFGADTARCGWVLLRPQPEHGRVDATLSWGPIAFDISTACDDDGIFVQLPAEARPATVAVRLQAPGWVDQGRGPAPAHLGRPVIPLAGHPHLRVRTAPVSLDPRPAGVRDGAGLLSITTPYAGSPPRFAGEGYGVLREGRCYVLEDVAEWATALLPTEPVKVDTIRRLERGSTPRCRYLQARLDAVYETGGSTAYETVDVHGARERFELRFPEFWVGPVWFEFLSETQPWAAVHVRQGRNEQAIRVVPGACVVDERRRRDAEPYVVRCPLGWRVRAGLGIRPGAPAVDLDPYGVRSAVAETMSKLPG